MRMENEEAISEKWDDLDLEETVKKIASGQNAYFEMKHVYPHLTVNDRVRLRRIVSETAKKRGVFMTYQDLEMKSGLVDAHRDINSYDDIRQLHSHSFLEILFCCSGDVEYLLGTRRYRIRKRDVIIIPPGVNHCPLLQREQDGEFYERIVIWVSAEFISSCYNLYKRFYPDAARGGEEIYPGSAGVVKRFYPVSTDTVNGGEDCSQEGFVLHLGSGKWDFLAESFHQICGESEREEKGWEIALCGETAELLVQLARAVEEGGHTLTEKEELLDSLVEYVSTHLDEKITLEDTARRFLISESTLSKTFRTRMNTSFYQFVTRCRLNAAKRMVEGDIPLNEIGERTGFCDYTSFYRAFKKKFALSPRQYRELMKNT